MLWPLTGREADLDRAMELIAAGTGVVFTGPAGVGKSRLLQEVTDRASRAGMATFTAVATESTRTIPFGPFARLLPETPSQDRLQMFQSALRRLATHAESADLLLSIDDAHHLDTGSLALASEAMRTDGVTVAATVRTGEELHPDLVDLWTNGVIERLEVAPLDRPQMLRLLESTLGQTDPDLQESLWRLTSGNPLLLHEVISGAEDRTIERDESGVWRETAALTGSSRLIDLVASRLQRLPEDLVPALACVAVGSPLPSAILREAIGDQFGELEQRRLIETMRAGDHEMVTAAHPLYGELFTAAIGRIQIEQANRRLLDAARRVPESADPLRVAVWQARSGANDDPVVAVRGAREALSRHDAALAEELVGPFADSDIEARIVLGNAVGFQSRFEEAERVLEAARAPTDDAHIAELASVRANNLGYGLGRVVDAVAILDDALESIGDSRWRSKLHAERGVISAIRGDLRAGYDSGLAAVQSEEATPSAKASGYVSMALALAMTGDCDGFQAIKAEAYAATSSTRVELPVAEDQVAVMDMCALYGAGRIAEALDLSTRYSSQVSPMRSLWLSASSVPLDLAGRLNDCLSYAVEARRLMRAFDPFGLSNQTRGIAAMALGQTGRSDDAWSHVAGIAFDKRDPRSETWVDRGRTWATAAGGDVDAAAHNAVEAGCRAIDVQHRAWGAPALHDAVRLGRPELVREDLTALRDGRGAHLIDAMADHADALAEGDGNRLVSVARSFGAMGVNLIAAEAAAQASRLLDGSDAAVAGALSMGWEGRCQDANTPALRARSASVSARELEVALAAAAGASSQEIAEHRYISVRTVDNHLRSAYRKLAVSGRQELRDVLDAVIPPPA